jgi:hypothetical protein
MDSPIGSRDNRDNEFYSYRYTTRFQKGDIVEIRTGVDLEYARFQARKSFPDVLNEYWWLKPSDVPALKELPLMVSDIYFYHGGVPVIVLLTASGTLARKTQIFLRKKDEPKNSIDSTIKNQLNELDKIALSHLFLDQNHLIRLEAVRVFTEKFPDEVPPQQEARMIFDIVNGNFDAVIKDGGKVVDLLVERLFVTSNARETERIIDTLIAIGEPVLSRLDDTSEFLSLIASPYYAKRINWTIAQIKKKKVKNGLV